MPRLSPARRDAPAGPVSPGAGAVLPASDRRPAGPATALARVVSRARHVATALLVVFAALLALPLQAQAQTECSDSSLTAQARIDTTEPPGSTNVLETDLDGVKITAGENWGIHLNHQGEGNTTITVENSCIETTGPATLPTRMEHHTAGVLGQSVTSTNPMTNVGDVTIDVRNSTIVTTGAEGTGIAGLHSNEGKVDIDVLNSTIKTQGEHASGIYGKAKNGDLKINVTDVNITTEGTYARGVHSDVPLDGDGDVTITVRGGEIITAKSHGIASDHNSAVGSLTIRARDVFRIETMGASASGIHGDRRKSATADDGLTIDLENGEITTRGANGYAVYGLIREGTGNLKTMLRNVDINTESTGAHGIVVLQGALQSGVVVGNSSGDIDIFLQDGSITTQGLNSQGIFAVHNKVDMDDTGDVRDIVINTRNHVITSESTDLDPTYLDTFSHGIYARHQSIGDIKIDVRSGGITTKGVFSYGLYARHEGDGDITIDTRDGHTITTTGADGHGIVAHHQGTMDSRSIAITVGGTVDARGVGAQGVRVGTLTFGAPARVAAIGAIDEYGEFVEPGEGGGYGEDVEYGYRRQTVTVNGSVTSAAEGVYLAGGGKVVIGPQGSIASESGIAILATGTVPEDTTDPNNVIPAILPKLWVDLNLGGRPVAQAIGNNWIMNDGGETTIAVNGTVLHEGATGVTGRTAANGVWNVRMREEGVNVDYITDPNPANWEMIEPTAGVVADRDFSAQDFNEARRPSPPPPPPPMPRTVMVDEPVFGDADEEAGVHLPAGGRVVIGPAGTVGGESGIAILAEGDAPMLHVDLRLDGRRVAEVIGDDWIINDGGETTIVVNDVTLHDGATGVVEDAVAPNGGDARDNQRGRRAGVVKDAMAPNGAFNVTMRPEGVTVMDRSDPDPANWVITEPAAGVVVDRDFSAEDFIETSTQPMFDEEYAPRAALYEILPDFLLRLTGPGPNRRCGSTPDSSVWTRVAGGQGVYESDRSTTGATYDLERFEAEGGLSASLGARAKGWVSVRHVQGTAGVASPTGGGEIDVRGLGSSVGGSWRGANDVYAVGCFSYMAYDVDFASTQQGVLKAGVDGHSYTLDLEVGRRYAVGEQWHLTPRVWVVGSRVSVDDFTDAVDARVSLANADRVLVGLGVQADTTRPWAGGAFLLRGSVDIEQMVSGATTTTQVSGARLSADATDTSLLFGLRGLYRHDRVTVGAELAARQELGSTDSEYTSFLNLGISF